MKKKSIKATAKPKRLTRKIKGEIKIHNPLAVHSNIFRRVRRI
jgi:hypothetical protein